MSKAKKKGRADRSTSISDEDIKLLKIIEFSGWIFLLVFAGFMAIWGLFDLALELIDITLDVVTFTFIVFTGTVAAILFGLATKIKKDLKNKKEYFMDWLVAIFLFGMFAIFALAIYQW